MKKSYLCIISMFLLVGCSVSENSTSNSGSSSTTETSSAVSYETKELTTEDIDNIAIGDSLESVYDALGKPLKEWSSEFVYESLDDAIFREELTVSLLGDSSDETEKYEKLIESGNKAKEINKLKMLQYTYIYDGRNEETALVWISPRTDTVVYTNRRSFINENGETPEKETGNSNDSAAGGKVDLPIPSLSYSIGDKVSFSSDDGGSIDLTIDSVSKYYGDDWNTPEGLFYAKVDFTVNNTGNDVFDINSHYFEFYDSDDIKSELDSKDFFSETIQAGKSAKGSAYFDVHVEGDSFEIFFADTSWTGEYQ